MRWLDAARRGTRLVHAHLTGALVPFHVVAAVTARCNLRCVYCSCPLRQEEEMTTAEWRTVLAECRSLGTERVLFFGGEPLLRTDLLEIVQHTRELGIHCTLVTNGILVPSRRDVVSLMHTVVVSLDGPEPGHDASRGRNSYRKAVRGIEAARAWGVPVKVNAVLNANNARDVDALVDFTRVHELPLTLNVMRSGTAELYKDAASHRLQDGDVRALLTRIIDLKRRNPHIVFSSSTYRILRRWPDFTVDRLDESAGGGEQGQPHCSAGRLHCFIYTDGRLYPCSVTVKQTHALDVRKVGVAAALEAASRHTCASCANACMIETNRLFALDPRVIASLSRAYLLRELN